MLWFNPRRISLPIPLPLSFPRKVAITIGNCIKDDEKIIGITPAVLTFSGILVDCPPYDLLPTTFWEYCTAILLSPSCRITVKTTNAKMIAMITHTARPAEAIAFPFTNWSNNVVISLGIREIMLITRTIDIPLPTPFSVILSPIHIRKADPAVSVNTTIAALTKLYFTRSP